MWLALRSLFLSDLNLAESLEDLLHSTSNKLFISISVIGICIYLYFAASYPQSFGWKVLGLACLLAVICCLSVRIMSKWLLMSLLIFQLGFFIVISLSAIVFHQPLIGFLLSLMPLLAVITIGWPAFILAEGMVALIIWATNLLTPEFYGSIGIAIAVGGIFTGIIGGEAIHSLLMVSEWSLYNYKKANEDLEEAREQRAILLQTQEDLLLAQRELTRLTNRLKVLNQMADEARRAKEEFVSSVSHELRTPLNMILGFTEAIVQSPRLYGTKLPPALLADIEVIRRNSLHLSRLIDDVLDLNRIDTGRMALTLEKISINEIIESAVAIVKPLYEIKKLFLHVQTVPELPDIHCDKTRVRQVIINLLSNAGRFTEVGGSTIQVTKAEKGVIISVNDTGPGISPEDQEKLFEPFVQLYHNRGGSGLGLSISKKLVDMHGGKIWLESKVGKGTTFFVYLPFEQALSIESYQNPSLRWVNPYLSVEPRMRPSRIISTKILPRYIVIDPGYTLYYLLKRYMPGAEVILASGTSEAMEQLRQTPAQALIVNAIGMDDDAVRPLMDEPLPFDTPIMMCWIPGEGNRDQLGVAKYLIKPVTTTDLVETINSLGNEIRTILIVDDEPDILRLFARIIISSKKNIRVLRATNVQEALENLKVHRVDAIILDLIMPEMNGFDFLAIKVKDKKIQKIPVIVITSQDPSNRPIMCKQLTITRYNGLSTSDLLSCIKSLCSVLTPIVQSDDPVPSESSAD